MLFEEDAAGVRCTRHVEIVLNQCRVMSDGEAGLHVVEVGAILSGDVRVFGCLGSHGEHLGELMYSISVDSEANDTPMKLCCNRFGRQFYTMQIVV